MSVVFEEFLRRCPKSGSPWRIRFHERDLSSQDFLSSTQDWVSRLENLGAVPGERVALHGPNHPALLAGLLACLKLKLVATVIYEGLVAEEKARFLHRLSPSLEISLTEEGRHQLQRLRAPGKVPESFQGGGLLFATSGTTSEGKFIFHHQGSLLQNAQLAAQHQKMNERSVILSTLSFSHTGGLNMQTLPALLSGARLVLCADRAPTGILNHLQEKEISHAILVPSQWRMLRQLESWKDARLENRMFLTGSSPIPTELIEEISQRGGEMIGVYGLTEIGPFVCLNRTNPPLPPGASGVLGQPISSYSMRVSAENEMMLQGPCIGQLWAGGDEEPSSILNEEGWLPTGDLGFEKDGLFYFTGRKKSLVNVGGFKVSPSEIENALTRHPHVVACAVTSEPHPLLGEVPVAYVVGPAKDKWDLINFLRGILSDVKIPRRIYFVERLPETSIGKNNYRLLKGS